MKSSDNGNSFGNTTRIASKNYGEAQIATSKNQVNIIWGGGDHNLIS
ncbi:MAG: hypothetical protein ACE5SW_09960 [Nitrososphaeraceae archaeon]